MASKPAIPKGTRDFIPIETEKRNYIFEIIKKVFKLFGYQPIETPAMENLETLMGKYGEEGDRLIFRILNSGDYLRKIDRSALSQVESLKLSNQICEKALRYDLTVPFARFVVQHQNDITFPFKRYQIQPVWRADRPQKGRYREFYQCDVDVIGSDSLLNEIELLQIVDRIFKELGIRILIKINNRKILAGIAETIGMNDKIIELTIAIDKLEKIGYENVILELRDKGFDDNAIRKVEPILKLTGGTRDKFDQLKNMLSNSEVGQKGIDEMTSIFNYLDQVELMSEVELDLTLARGLNYYTGAIIEVKALDVEMGSICGGGRYDDLTGIFGLNNVSGVGISFGADRIYDVLTQLNKFPEEVGTSSKVLITNFGKEEEIYCLNLLRDIRINEIPAEYYPANAKLKKQMSYANAKNIPFVILIGKEEMEKGEITIKDMIVGKQFSIAREEVISFLKQN